MVFRREDYGLSATARLISDLSPRVKCVHPTDAGQYARRDHGPGRRRINNLRNARIAPHQLNIVGPQSPVLTVFEIECHPISDFREQRLRELPKASPSAAV